MWWYDCKWSPSKHCEMVPSNWTKVTSIKVLFHFRPSSWIRQLNPTPTPMHALRLMYKNKRHQKEMKRCIKNEPIIKVYIGYWLEPNFDPLQATKNIHIKSFHPQCSTLCFVCDSLSLCCYNSNQAIKILNLFTFILSNKLIKWITKLFWQF